MTKYQIFTILPQISHFHKNRNFLKYICNFLDQLLHAYKFHGRDMSGVLFFIFASCEPLTQLAIKYVDITINLKLLVFLSYQRKFFKGEIGRGVHLAITSGGWVIVPPDFCVAKPTEQFHSACVALLTWT